MFIRTVYANQKGFWARILWLSSKAIFDGSFAVDEERKEEKQQLEADIRQSIDPKSDTGFVVKQVGFPQESSTEKEEKKLNLPYCVQIVLRNFLRRPPEKPDSPEKQGHKSNSHFRGKKKSSSSAD